MSLCARIWKHAIASFQIRLADLWVLSHTAEDSQICDLREAKGASSRIKIQLIEFLCDKTGGAQIGEMAEGSQICDFD